MNKIHIFSLIVGVAHAFFLIGSAPRLQYYSVSNTMSPVLAADSSSSIVRNLKNVQTIKSQEVIDKKNLLSAYELDVFAVVCESLAASSCIGMNVSWLSYLTSNSFDHYDAHHYLALLGASSLVTLGFWQMIRVQKKINTMRKSLKKRANDTGATHNVL